MSKKTLKRLVVLVVLAVLAMVICGIVLGIVFTTPQIFSNAPAPTETVSNITPSEVRDAMTCYCTDTQKLDIQRTLRFERVRWDVQVVNTGKSDNTVQVWVKNLGNIDLYHMYSQDSRNLNKGEWITVEGAIIFMENSGGYVYATLHNTVLIHQLELWEYDLTVVSTSNTFESALFAHAVTLSFENNSGQILSVCVDVFTVVESSGSYWNDISFWAQGKSEPCIMDIPEGISSRTFNLRPKGTTLEGAKVNGWPTKIEAVKQICIEIHPLGVGNDIDYDTNITEWKMVDLPGDSCFTLYWK